MCLTQEADVLRKPIAAWLIAFTLAAVPVMAQTSAPGPTPQQPGAAPGTTAPGAQGKVVGTPQEPGATEAKSWAQAVPITYMTVAVVGVTAAVLYVLYRRRRRGRE
jgi:hypothetical protein